NFADQTSGTQFGSPGSSSPSGDGGTFTGWRGDPSVTAVTDSGWGTGWQKAVVVTNIAATSTRPSYGDAIVALSPDGGETWGNPHRFNFGFTTLPSGCTSGSEGIAVVWADFPTSEATVRCNPNGSRQNQGAVTWAMAIYDTGTYGGKGPGYWLSQDGTTNCSN